MENIFEKLSEITKPTVPCKNCKGDGELYVSSCCGAYPRGNGDSDTSDYGICSDCGDHCEYGVKCELCDGTGII